MTIAMADCHPAPAASQCGGGLPGSVWRFMVQALGADGSCASYGSPLDQAAPTVWRDDLLDELLDVPVGERCP